MKMLMIRKDFDIFGGALVIQKKLLQELPVKSTPTTNTLADIRKIFNNNNNDSNRLLKYRKRLSKSSTNMIRDLNYASKSSNSDIDEQEEEEEEENIKRNTTTIVLNKKIKLSKRNLNNSIKIQKSSLKSLNNNNSTKNNNIKNSDINKTKKFKSTRSASSHETSKISFNNSSIQTFKTNSSLNNNNNTNYTRRSSTSIPFRQNNKINLNNNARQPFFNNKLNETKPNTNETNQEPQQLDKRQRFDIYMKLLDSKPGAKSIQEAILLINSTLDEVEEKHAPKKDDKVFGINSKKYGRMNPVPEERIKINPNTGKMEMLTTGLTIVLDEDGSFDIWTIKRGNLDMKRIYHKKGLKIASSTSSSSSSSS